MVEVRNLFYKTEDKSILNDISIKFPEKKFIGILNVNTYVTFYLKKIFLL